MSTIRADTITNLAGTAGPSFPMGFTSPFQIKTLASDVALVAGGYINDGSYNLYGTYFAGSNTFGEDLSLNLKTEVNSGGVTAPAANTTYYLYFRFDLAGSAQANGLNIQTRRAAKGATSGFFVSLQAPSAVDTSVYYPIAAIRSNASSIYTSFQNISPAPVQVLKAGASTFGIIPLGGIIAVAANLAGAMAIPASGTVSNGFMRADGAAIPAGQTLSGTLPNLADNRFLMGTTSAGVTGGGNSIVLSTANLPSHSHAIDHDHATFTSGAGSAHSHGSGTLSGTAAAQSWSGSTTSNGAHDHAYYFNTPSGLGIGGADGRYMLLSSITTPNPAFPAHPPAQDGGHSHTLSGSNVASAATINAGSTANESAHTHPIDVPAFIGTSGTTGSGTSFDNRPLYLSTVYLVRVS